MPPIPRAAPFPDGSLPTNVFDPVLGRNVRTVGTAAAVNHFGPVGPNILPVQPAVQPRASRPVAEADSARGPSLQPREVKLEKPMTFDGQKKNLHNFLYVM